MEYDKTPLEEEIEDLKQKIIHRDNTIKKLRIINLQLQEGTKHGRH